jgi:hypothetical protein
MPQITQIHFRNEGFTALLIVLIITAAGLTMATSAVWLGVGGLELTRAWQGADQARQVAEGCAENALERLKFDSNYNGETLFGSGQSCIITVEKTGAPMTAASLVITGHKGDYHQTITISLEVAGEKFNILFWQANRG